MAAAMPSTSAATPATPSATAALLGPEIGCEVGGGIGGYNVGNGLGAGRRGENAAADARKQISEECATMHSALRFGLTPRVWVES
jgi:hypothetical protein